MNFLAHQFLSGNSSDIKIGNFIADSVKGKAVLNFSETIQQGIAMHRAIDDFTDHHEIVDQSKIRLREKYRKYAGVIVDVYYDHYLAKNWNEYSDIPLLRYTEDVYSLMFKHYFTLPNKMKGVLPFMAHNNWLYNYSKIDGIQSALTGLSRRTSFKSNMEHAHEDLITHYQEFEQEFREFFPILVKFAQDYLKNIKQ